MTGFFNAWNALGTNPGDQALRRSVISEGEALAGEFNRLHGQLSRIAGDVDTRVENYAKEADRLLKEVATLNIEISQAEGSGGGGPEQRVA